MSHFAVLVITDQAPTQELLASILQPWHEYECTGVDDEYVIDLDVTDEVQKDWQKLQKAVRLADGRLVSKYDEEVWVETGEVEEFGRRKRALRLPKGATELEVPQSELSAAQGETMEQWAESYGGWERKPDGRFYRHTNPNKKWDWWQVGGRYQHRLVVASTILANSAQMQELNLHAMKKNAESQRRSWAQKCCTNSKTTWEEMEIACREQESAHKDWLTLPEPRPRGEKYSDWLTQQGGNRTILARAQKGNWELPETGSLTLDEWVAAAPPLSSYAVIHEGKWYQRGEMGWWGITTGDKPADEWESEIAKLLTALRPDQWITVVDCHI